MSEKIQICIDNNERNSGRDHDLIMAAHDDPRFAEPTYGELDVDVRFCRDVVFLDHDDPEIFCGPTRYYNVELKEPSDYVSSTLNASGHLYEQYLGMAEDGHPCMILVLGSDQDIHDAIWNALKTRYKGKELAFQYQSYIKRLSDFEANAEALGCPVERWASMPYSRLLSRVAKRLLGASLMDYRPRPIEAERKIAAFCILVGNGIGPVKAKAILEKFDLCLMPKEEIGAGGMLVDHPDLIDCPGIGPKLAAKIRERIEVLE